MAKGRYWLIKSEPDVYSIDDLRRDGKTGWDGVRNYQARNFMRDEMRAGDRVLFYHSNAEPNGVAGVCRVCGPARPDLTALDRKSPHFDPKATAAEPIWVLVDVAFEEKFSEPVTLARLKSACELSGMPLLQRGQRLSVMPIDETHFRIVCELGRGKGKGQQ